MLGVFTFALVPWLMTPPPPPSSTCQVALLRNLDIRISDLCSSAVVAGTPQKPRTL